MDVSAIPEEQTSYKWIIEPEMFRDCPDPAPVNGPVKAEGEVHKAGTTVYFSGRAAGEFSLTCSLCAKTFTEPVEVEAEAVFIPLPEPGKGEESGQDAADTEETSFYSGDKVDFFPPLRDQIVLAVPMRPLCVEDCKGLCPHCGTDLNVTQCGCKEGSGDPRFAQLKKLLKGEEGNAGS